MSRLILGLAVIIVMLVTVYTGWEYYNYYQNLNRLSADSAQTKLLFNPIHPGIKAVNFYNLALADDVDLILPEGVDITEIEEAELQTIDFTIVVNDSLMARRLEFSREDFLKDAKLLLVDNDARTREQIDLADVLFQVNFTENYTSRRPIYSVTTEFIKGKWYINSFTIGI